MTGLYDQLPQPKPTSHSTALLKPNNAKPNNNEGFKPNNNESFKPNNNESFKPNNIESFKPKSILSSRNLKIFDVKTKGVKVDAEVKYCEICKIEIRKLDYMRHVTSTAHLVEKEGIMAPKNLHVKPDNVGFKMLIRAGWDYNKGLGAQEQGRREPILPKKKVDRAGIGAKGRTKPAFKTVNNLSKKQIAKQQDIDRGKRLKIMRYLNS